MYFWFSFAIFLSVATAQEEFVFSNDKESLSLCIENYLLYSSDPYYKETGIAKEIADVIARRFFRKTKTKSVLINAANNLYYDLRDSKKYSSLRRHQIHEPLQLTMKDALIYCAVYNRSNHMQPMPVFTNEPPEIGALLDYILVDWSTLSLNNMMRSRIGRSVLRRYAEEAGVRLAVALNYVMDHGYFRYLLRYYWMLRAQRYFDGRESHIPYLRHRYTGDYPFPHTYDNYTELSSRNDQNLSDRNPLIFLDDFYKIMYVHIADRPGSDENDVFSVYQRNSGMSSAEYYIESHIDQFYRTLFLFLELQIYSVSSNEKDIYKGPLPYSVITARLPVILYSDDAYRY